MKKWTVLFIVHGLGAGLEEQSRVLTRVIGYGNWQLNHADFLYLRSEMDGKRINSVLYKANSLNERRSGKPDITRLKSFKNINIGNKNRLTGIFSHVRRNYPSENLMIVFFDHGAGFGIFEPTPEKFLPNFNADMDEVDETLTTKNHKKTRKIFVPPVSSVLSASSSGTYDNHYKQHILNGDKGNAPGYLHYYRRKNSKTDMLTMEELSEAIGNGFRRKVDVMVMVNCNMQMIDTGYTLRKNVDFLIGSETLFWVYGINYREVLFRIDRIRHITPEKIARVCIDTLKFRYERIGKEQNLSDVCFNAIALQKMFPVYEKLDELAGKLVAAIKSDIKKIGRARKAGIELSQNKLPKKQKDEYESSLFYDLVFFLQNLGSYNAEVNEIGGLLEKAIVAKYTGSEFTRRTVDLVNGISVFLPFTKDDFEMQYFNLFYKAGAKFRVDFAKTNWGKLLMTIKKQVER